MICDRNVLQTTGIVLYFSRSLVLLKSNGYAWRVLNPYISYLSQIKKKIKAKDQFKGNHLIFIVST